MFFYIGIILIVSTQYMLPTTPIAPKTPPSIPLTYAFDYEASVVFQAISLPLQDVTDPFTLNIFAQIENNFGPNGLKLNSNQILLI